MEECQAIECEFLGDNGGLIMDNDDWIDSNGQEPQNNTRNTSNSSDQNSQ